MPRLETEISELATALGALGHDLSAGLDRRPDQVLNVAEVTWARLREAYESGEHRLLFMTSWANGHAFLWARDGLRGRLPIRVEWKGPDRQVEQDIDNVFLVSVKSRSAVLWNRSPSQVFSRTPRALHWYEHTAADEYQALYAAARTGRLDAPAGPSVRAHTERRVGARSPAALTGVAGSLESALPGYGGQMLDRDRSPVERSTDNTGETRAACSDQGPDRFEPGPVAAGRDLCEHPLQVYRTPWPADPRANIQDDHGKAKPYQVRQLLAAIEKLEEKQS